MTSSPLMMVSQERGVRLVRLNKFLGKGQERGNFMVREFEGGNLCAPMSDSDICSYGGIVLVGAEVWG